jgi:hypothetical protein
VSSTVEEPLVLTVDAVELQHGTLRIDASMEDGSPDVTVSLGPGCDGREVGGGFAGRDAFVWHLSSDEIADAVSCDLVVRVHARGDDGRPVCKVATLPVALAVLAAEEDAAVRLVTSEASGATTKLTFRSRVAASRLHVGNVLLGAEDDDEPDVDEGRTSSFLVANDDLARAMIVGRPLTLLGASFQATVSVGNVTLDASPPSADDSPHESEEG